MGAKRSFFNDKANVIIWVSVRTGYWRLKGGKSVGRDEYKPNPIWKVRRRCFGAIALFFFHSANLRLDMSVALLIHRPPTPSRLTHKSLGNRLYRPTSKQESPLFSASQRTQNNSQLCCCHHNNMHQNYTEAQTQIFIVLTTMSEKSSMVQQAAIEEKTQLK